MVIQAAVAGDHDRSSENGLSDREMEVLACLSQGKTTCQIAGALYISKNTVKTHLRYILEKLEATHRAEAASKAAQMGLIGSQPCTELLHDPDHVPGMLQVKIEAYVFVRGMR